MALAAILDLRSRKALVKRNSGPVRDSGSKSTYPLHAHKGVWPQARLADDGHVRALPPACVKETGEENKQLSGSQVGQLLQGS